MNNSYLLLSPTVLHPIVTYPLLFAGSQDDRTIFVSGLTKATNAVKAKWTVQKKETSHTFEGNHGDSVLTGFQSRLFGTTAQIGEHTYDTLRTFEKNRASQSDTNSGSAAGSTGGVAVANPQVGLFEHTLWRGTSTILNKGSIEGKEFDLLVMLNTSSPKSPLYGEIKQGSIGPLLLTCKVIKYKDTLMPDVSPEDLSFDDILERPAIRIEGLLSRPDTKANRPFIIESVVEETDVKKMPMTIRWSAEVPGLTDSWEFTKAIVREQLIITRIKPEGWDNAHAATTKTAIQSLTPTPAPPSKDLK